MISLCLYYNFVSYPKKATKATRAKLGENNKLFLKTEDIMFIF